jgi:hypothetical protein
MAGLDFSLLSFLAMGSKAEQWSRRALFLLSIKTLQQDTLPILLTRINRFARKKTQEFGFPTNSIQVIKSQDKFSFPTVRKKRL